MKSQILDSVSDELIQKKITLQGLASISKAGVCLQVKNNQVVFLPEIEDWDADYLDQTVKVTGLLQKKKLTPDVMIDEDKGNSQGITGKQYQLLKIKKIEIIE